MHNTLYTTNLSSGVASLLEPTEGCGTMSSSEPTLYTTDPSSDAASALGAADSCDPMTQSVLCTADPSSDAASPLGAADSCEPLIQSDLHMTNISDDTASLLGVADGCEATTILSIDPSVTAGAGDCSDGQLDRNEGLTVNSVSSQKDTVYHDKGIMTNNINWDLHHKIKMHRMGQARHMTNPEHAN